MAQFKDLSLNGQGVNLNSMGEGAAVDISAADATIRNANILLVGGAGNVIMRYPQSSADVTIVAIAGQAIPITSGTIVRKIGTTATGLASVPAK